MPLPRLRSYDDQLADYLRGRLDILLDSTGLDARNVADIAVVAAAACEEFTAATHLLDLLAAIPPPTGNPDFWQALGKASDTPHLIPANIGPRVLRALEGDPAGLADQVLSAFGEITASHRAAAAKVVGGALADTADLAGFDHTYIGTLWLTDLEQTAWRVLLAARTRPESFHAARLTFRAGWKDA
ncbi:hypothetical protein [Streptomyces sp. NBC_01477]|uniref:hypothetical protein n=1 Tax=Streptomyces sp. NBC_01477 TaxID=2976015 RepID=UPI002E32E0C2|nr:hypothetical protein [Streptomyces sp. NBC_01477]